MDTSTIVQIMGVVLLILVPACGWLISTVISQGKELAGQEAANQVKFKGYENCDEMYKTLAEKNMDWFRRFKNPDCNLDLTGRTS